MRTIKTAIERGQKSYLSQIISQIFYLSQILTLFLTILTLDFYVVVLYTETTFISEGYSMIYTLGHKQAYLGAIASEGRIKKLGKGIVEGQPYSGGSVWETFEEAQQVLRFNPGFMVFGVDADWKTDTEPEKNASFHNLLRDAWIIVLNNE